MFERLENDAFSVEFYQNVVIHCTHVSACPCPYKQFLFIFKFSFLFKYMILKRNFNKVPENVFNVPIQIV